MSFLAEQEALAEAEKSTITKAKRLQKLIEEAHFTCETIEREVREMAGEKKRIHEELLKMQERCRLIDLRFSERQAEYHRISRDVEKHELAYMQLLEAAPTLVHVLKGKKY